MVASPDTLQLLRTGLYTIPEAAFYARIATRTLNRWLFGDADGEAVLRPQFEGERLVTFVDFVEALAVRAIRLERQIPLQRIRQAVKIAEQHYGVKHPLARKHVTFLLGSEIVIRLNEDQPDERIVQVSGKHAHQPLMRAVVELYLQDIGFDAQGLANEFCIFSQATSRVMMRPHLRFGEPIVESCGYTAQALWEASKAEGGIGAAAVAYGVTEEEVSLACRCYDHLIGRSAA